MVDLAQGVTQQNIVRLPIFPTLGTTFRIFGRAPLFFLALSVLAAAPGLVRLAILGAAAQTLSASAWVIFVINLFLTYLCQTAMTYAAARLYDGRPLPAIGEALGVGRRRLFMVLAAVLLVTLAGIVGTALLIVPGLIVFCMFAVTTPVCMLEPLGPVDSMKRSKVLTQGSRWRIFWIYVLSFGPLIALSMANTYLLTRLDHVLEGIVVNAVASLVWAPLVTILGAVMYIELRRLKENVGVAGVFD